MGTNCEKVHCEVVQKSAARGWRRPDRPTRRPVGNGPRCNAERVPRHRAPAEPFALLAACEQRDDRTAVRSGPQGGEMRRASEVTAFSEFAEACAPSLYRTAYLM